MTDDINKRRRERQESMPLRRTANEFARGRNGKTNLETTIDESKVAAGVTATWLASVFGMKQETIRTKLAQCPVAARRGSLAIYELKVAAQFLVKPVVDMEQYLKTVKIEDLPVRFQEAYWDVQRKRLKFEEDAGLLWRSADVAAKFGEIFLAARSAAKQWVDDLQDKHGLTEAQRLFLDAEVDVMLGMIRAKINELPRETKSELQRMNEEMARQKAEELDSVAVENARNASDSDDYTQLI